MAFHEFKDEEGGTFGSFEVFEVTQRMAQRANRERDHKLTPGWYWWACFPGCLPDGEPNGPFESEQDAINDAQGEV